MALQRMLPLVEELPAALEAPAACERLAHWPHVIFFDSARREPTLGRYSFVAADPWHFVRVDHPHEPPNSPTQPDALAHLESLLAPYHAETVPELPPFQGGAAGLLGYELGRQLERIPVPAFDEFQTPILAAGLYDVVCAFDHQTGRAWLISQGFPETDPVARRARAEARLARFREALRAPARPAWRLEAGHAAISLADLAPQHRVPAAHAASVPALTSNFSLAAYLQAVARAIEYIRAGDIFQVNLAQRLLHPASVSSWNLYQRLRERNPAPFAGYFDLGDVQLASASPERFVQVRGGLVETRPIKGTRRRAGLPEADLFTGDQLLASAKDRSENVMIVDLLRNDLARVCRAESVHVTGLCRLEVYEFVQHLVSEVRGELRPGLGPLDLLRAAFPGGSITGAPKPRAMEVIAELEPTARGPYCGSLAYVGFDGACDSSILIRTITAAGGWWQAPVGGGIVAASDPEDEYAETWHKASGLLRAME